MISSDICYLTHKLYPHNGMNYLHTRDLNPGIDIGFKKFQTTLVMEIHEIFLTKHPVRSFQSAQWWFSTLSHYAIVCFVYISRRYQIRLHPDLAAIYTFYFSLPLDSFQYFGKQSHVNLYVITLLITFSFRHQKGPF